MIPDLDIFRAANVLVKHHGQDAPVHAAMRADELLEERLISVSRAGSILCGNPALQKS